MGTAPGTESNNYPNFTKDLFAAEASPYYAAFVEDTYRPKHRRSRSLPGCAGTSSAARQSGITGWNISTRPRRTRRTVSPTPARKLRQQRQPLAVCDQPEELRPAAWVSRGSRPKHLVVRGGGGFYYGPSAQMVGGAGLDSDGYSSTHDVECDLPQRRRQHGVERLPRPATGQRLAVQLRASRVPIRSAIRFPTASCR